MAHIIKFCSQAYHHAGNGQNVTKPAHFWTFDSQPGRLCNFELNNIAEKIFLDCLQFFSIEPIKVFENHCQSSFLIKIHDV